MVFNLFKSLSNKDVVDFLVKIVRSLPKEYHYLLTQLNTEFILGVRKYNDTHENWYSLKLNSSLYEKYSNGGDFLLKKIYIENQEIKIDINKGVIFRFSCPKRSIIKIKNLEIDRTELEIINYEDIDLKELNSILKGKIVVRETFKINLDNHIYYVIKNLGDGNYVSIDIDGKVYKMEHDPFQITLLYSNLDMYIKNLGNVSD